MLFFTKKLCYLLGTQINPLFYYIGGMRLKINKKKKAK